MAENIKKVTDDFIKKHDENKNLPDYMVDMLEHADHIENCI